MENRTRQLAGTSAMLLAGKIGSQLVSFLLLPLYTAILAPQAYGIVDLFNTYTTLLLPIVSFQLDMGLFRFMLDVRGREDQHKKMLSTVMLINGLQVAVYALIYILVQTHIHSEYKIFLLLHVVLNVASNTFLQFARGRGNNSAYAVASFLSATVMILLNVLFVAVLRIGALGLFLGVVGGNVAQILYLFFSQKIWRYFSIRGYDRKIAKDISRFSIPLIPSVISWWTINASDRTVIAYFLNTAANGIYSIASKFSAMISVVYNIFYLAWSETVSQHIDDADINSFLSSTINDLYKLFFSFCLCLISVMPFVFPFFVNAQYNEAKPLIPILVMAVFFSILCGLFSVVFHARKNTKENAKTAIFAAIINLAIDIVFIRKLGLYAAALATLIAFLSMTVYRYFSVQKYTRIKMSGKMVLFSLFPATLVFVAYYTDIVGFQVIAFAFAITYSVLANRRTLRSLITIVLERLRKGNPL